jgi:preprotein translocase subunit SecE
MEETVKTEKTPKTEKTSKTDKAPKKSWSKGLKAEFKRISWPDRESLVKQSVAVVSVSVVLGAIIAVLDVFIRFGVDFIVSFPK